MQLAKANNYGLAAYGLRSRRERRGWWGKLFNTIIKGAIQVAGPALSAINPLLGAAFNKLTQPIVKNIDEGGGTLDFGFKTANGQTPYNPTTAEAAVINAWVSKLNPFYKSLVEQLGAAFNTARFETQLSMINEVMLKISVVKEYFAKYETTGLSSQAQLMRLDIIDEIMAPAETLIEETFIQNGVMAKLQTQNITIGDHIGKFGSLIGGGARSVVVPVKKYVVMSSGVTPTPTTPVQPVTPGATPTTTTTTGTTAAPVKSKKTIGLVVAGIAILAVVLWPSDNNKSN